MRFRRFYGSHLPLLMALVERTSGPILEVGMGLFSTPYLHWRCYIDKRKLVSYENEANFFERDCRQWAADFHEVHFVKDWDEMPVEGPWAIALIDQVPKERRIVEIDRLAPFTKYIVVHDSERTDDDIYQAKHQYNYRKILPLFKHKYNFRCGRNPQTLALSNDDDLEWLQQLFD